jgi:hypothetical protein
MRILTAAVFCSLALAGCNKKDDTAIIVRPPEPAPTQPVEGVYPDCKFGVTPPDDGTTRCAKAPAN